MTVLHTRRLTLRPIQAEDTAALLAMLTDPELGRHHPGDLTDPDEIVALVRRRLDYRGPAGTGDWVFELDGTMVGIGHLRTSTELPGGVLECGLYLARAHWGSGLAEEAARAVLGHAHHTLGVPAVFALVHEENPRAQRFVERLGFLEVGSGTHYGAVHRVLVSLAEPAGVHHVELWAADLASAERTFGWLFTELGWHEYQRWPRGMSWRRGAAYVVVEDSPDRCGDRHERTRPGLNHLALHVATRADLDRIVAGAPEHGWHLMFADKHPHAGGPEHLAGYLENDDGFEVELVVAQHTP